MHFLRDRVKVLTLDLIFFSKSGKAVKAFRELVKEALFFYISEKIYEILRNLQV
jgi:hypothetical protein